MFEQLIAVLSDIHGNRWALEAVIEDIKRRGIQQIINLGDILYGPLDPTGTFRILVDNNIMSIQGNQDRILWDSSENITDNLTLQFVKQSLSSVILSWLKKLDTTMIVNNELFLCHGSPKCDDEYLVEEILENGVLLKSTSKLVEELSAIEQEVILCGHSHVPRIVSISTGQLIINPGSVGLPAYTDDNPYPHIMETGTPHARYSTLFKNNTGWHIENIAIPYDWQSASSTAMKNDRADWAKWLREGRA